MRRTVVVVALTLTLGLWSAGDAAAQEQDPTRTGGSKESEDKAKKDKEETERIEKSIAALRSMLDPQLGRPSEPVQEIRTYDPGGRPKPPSLDLALSPLLIGIAREDRDVHAAAREVLLAHLATAKAEEESRQWDLEEHRDVYAVTNRISRAAAVVVHLIVAVTLWAAVSEFRHAQRRRKAVGDQVTEIAIGADKVAVKTALHGLLLLTVGFAFYFLYVKFIYPIT